MAGSFLRQVKKTPEIAPLVLIVSGACVGAIGMTIRAAMRNPDASWDRANNQHPWLKIKPNEQVKLIPLFVVVGAGCVGAAGYVMRLALKNPDCTWDRKNNPYPWQKIKHNECKKFYSIVDFKTLEDPRPNVKLD
ncbi:unnamed protein product [Porites evermanni]|uniref:NADH dehydrogenase [ubiquinone] 1 alpha subcomplex subunit 4 n=1 Tax=Porites evermanni TaxID=104178 RepID=A0ABN8LNY0_9CNID|nr:unnamed protein product [Porites evermanni]